MPRRSAGPLALCLSTAVLAGCGEGPATAVEGRTITVTLDEYRIVPQQISASAGRLRVAARNDGLLTHNLVIETDPKNPNATPQRRKLKTLHGGQRTSRSFTLRPGSYRLVCTIANHETLGQYGTLIVR